jgi:hypothetical protein
MQKRREISRKIDEAFKIEPEVKFSENLLEESENRQ